MKRSSIFVFAIALLFFAPLPGGAQDQVETAKPIKLKAPKRKIEKFKGEVLVFDSQKIVVRSPVNTAIVRTFNFTPEVRQQMQKIIDRGGYQYGDKVEIHCEPGSNVAIKIKGKPSKPR